MSKMGFHDPFGHLKHKLWQIKGLRIKLSIWFLTVKNQELPWFPCVGGVPHVIGKTLTNVINLLETSPQSKVCTQSYGLSKLQEFQFRDFWDSILGVSGQNDIWVLVLWLGTKNTIKGEGGGFLQIWAMVSLMSLCLLMIRPCTKSAITMQ